ncbi:MAG: hypothetical protein QXW35_04350, partial [Candidatus Aenigmatarchaeota archaeon]
MNFFTGTNIFKKLKRIGAIGLSAWEISDSYKSFNKGFRDGVIRQSFPIGPDLLEAYQLQKMGGNMKKLAFLGPLGAGIGLAGMYGVYKDKKREQEMLENSIKMGIKHFNELAEQDPYLSQIPKEDLEEYF